MADDAEPAGRPINQGAPLAIRSALIDGAIANPTMLRKAVRELFALVRTEAGGTPASVLHVWPEADP